MVQIEGRLLGRRHDPKDGSVVGDVIQTERSYDPDGPAENALILVEHEQDHHRGRYISWITYFDIEYAARREEGTWTLVEPAVLIERNIAWHPFGWPGAGRVPIIGDEIIEKLERR